MTITGGQVKAARGLLGWTLKMLESKSGVTSTIIANFEAGKGRPSVLQLTVIGRVIEAAGIEFFERQGVANVRLRKSE
jgi:transcriptional regulator with XRE-family HTH domain